MNHRGAARFVRQLEKLPTDPCRQAARPVVFLINLLHHHPMPNPDLRPSTFHLRRRTPGSFLLVPFPAMGRSIRCQGQLEAAAVQILAACPLVKNFHEQPFKIWYAWSDSPPDLRILDEAPQILRCDRRVSYIVPDFWVEMASGARRLVEVKPARKLNQPIVRRKLAAAELYAKQQGWTFFVLDEQQLLRAAVLDNLRLLARFRRSAEDVASRSALAKHVLSSRTITLSDLLQSLQKSCASSTDSARCLATIYHLIAAGHVDVDLAAGPIGPATILYPGGTRPWDPFVSLWEPSGSWTGGFTASSDS